MLPVWIAALLAAPAQESTDLKTYRDSVQSILAKHCVGCHGPEKQKAKLRIDTLDPDLVGGNHAETWHEVLNKINRGEMPPEDKPQLLHVERRALVAWLTAELKRADRARKGAESGVVLRRLTRYEYANTMRDLLGVDLDYARDLPPESSSRDGFQNNGSSLGISALQVQAYLEIARTALDKAIVTGPRPELLKHRTEKNEGRFKKSKGVDLQPNELRPLHTFAAKMMKFPRQGEILIRVTAEVNVPEDMPHPVMQIMLGHRADVKGPAKVLTEVAVPPTAKGPLTREFRCRIEEFPLPGHNPKFPGLVVRVTNAWTDGTYPLPGQKPKRVKGKPQPKQPLLKPAPTIVVKAVEIEGPIFDAWPPATHTDILFPRDGTLDDRAYAREVVRRFMARAFRRPATDADLGPALAFYDEIRPNAPSFEAAIKDVLAMVLVSPDFLYLVEPLDPAGADRQPLTGHELASRLSYFLFSSMPDAELAELAAKGTLDDPAVLERQVRRMLADPRSWEFVVHFSDQWLDLSAMDRVAVNPEYYPDFDDRLKKEMRRETHHFFAEVLRKDLPAFTLLDSDFAMLNEPLARHYGIEGPRGLAFERVALEPGRRRGGLLTQGSMLLGNSTGEDSHPIRRAVWILKRLLNDPPAPPPPDVPALDEEDPEFASLPVKRQLELHRKKEACNDCHRGIDPWGVALENFDGVGLWRESVKRRVPKKKDLQDFPVVSKTALPGGVEIDSIDGLKAHLVTREKERFARGFTEKLLSYALGRSLDGNDRATVDALTATFAKSGHKIGDLIAAIVRSDLFRTKQGTLVLGRKE